MGGTFFEYDTPYHEDFGVVRERLVRRLLASGEESLEPDLLAHLDFMDLRGDEGLAWILERDEYLRPLQKALGESARLEAALEIIEAWQARGHGALDWPELQVLISLTWTMESPLGVIAQTPSERNRALTTPEIEAFFGTPFPSQEILEAFSGSLSSLPGLEERGVARGVPMYDGERAPLAYRVCGYTYD
jgi:hypothetical protein